MKAGLLNRFSSTLMDAVVLLLLSFAFISLLFSLTGVDYYGTELISENCFNSALFLLFFDISFGIFLAYLLSEVFIPLLLKRGETIGKRIFSLSLVRLDNRRVEVGTLILRGLVGKYLIETLPVVLLSLCSFFFYSGICPIIAILLTLFFVAFAVFCKDHRAIHDIISGTVVVESQEWI